MSKQATPDLPVRRFRILVTGGAGFIGSALCRRLLDEGHQVVVVDHLREHRSRLAAAELAGVRLLQGDLAEVDLRPVLAEVDRVVHLAGQPGVQSSWGGGFDQHVDDNLRVTQRLLEAMLAVPVERLVVASSSSVYGNVATGFAGEDRPVDPVSPYGVSKAAVELLLRAYARRGVPGVALRYFTVYGRRQRPDMAFSRILDAAMGGPPFPLRGDAQAARDFTHVDDVVDATVRALRADLEPGTVLNVGSGRPVTLDTVIRTVEELLGVPVPITVRRGAAGDPARTAADFRRCRQLLGWSPRVELRQGLLDQIRAHPRRPPAGVRPGEIRRVA